jgi:hypothetical protein
MWAAQTNEQQMEQTEPRVDAEHPPKKPPGREMSLMSSEQVMSFLDAADGGAGELAAAGWLMVDHWTGPLSFCSPET